MLADTFMPKRSTIGSAGYDFRAQEDYDLEPGRWTRIDLGVRFDGTEYVEVPVKTDWRSKGLYHHTKLVCSQWVMLLLPRSSYGMKYGFRFRNTVGVIDQSYRDNMVAEVTVEVPLSIKKGDKICQGIILPFGTFRDEMEPTDERTGGLGSTGR